MAMELRHLRYFVAVVEEGSLTTAAELRLHTSQPSLSRQIRDLEYEVGAELLSRSVHGVELTAMNWWGRIRSTDAADPAGGEGPARRRAGQVRDAAGCDRPRDCVRDRTACRYRCARDRRPSHRAGVTRPTPRAVARRFDIPS